MVQWTFFQVGNCCKYNTRTSSEVYCNRFYKNGSCANQHIRIDHSQKVHFSQEHQEPKYSPLTASFHPVYAVDFVMSFNLHISFRLLVKYLLQVNYPYQRKLLVLPSYKSFLNSYTNENWFRFYIFY